MPRYRRNMNTAGRIIDGLAFVVTPDDNKLHTLNAAATRLWEISQRGLDVDSATKALVETYEIDDATARTDAQACLDDLLARKILVLE